jgi:MoxR-like ATPase
MAYLQGRDYVVPKDVAPLIADTLSHRLILRPEAENEGLTAEKILDDITRSVQTPRISLWA